MIHALRVRLDADLGGSGQVACAAAFGEAIAVQVIGGKATGDFKIQEHPETGDEVVATGANTTPDRTPSTGYYQITDTGVLPAQ